MADPNPTQMSLLVTFFSVSAALYAQNKLGGPGVQCRVVPVPRAVSSSCGYALEVCGLPADAVAAWLDQGDIEWAAVYHRQADGRGERYERALVNLKEVQDDA